MLLHPEVELLKKKLKIVFLSQIQQMAMNGPLELHQRVETNVYLTPLHI